MRLGLYMALAAAGALMASAVPAHAHHILGIPHYSYDKDYPQTPVLTYKARAGRYKITMTGYPGVISPGERCSLHVYVSERASGELYDGTVTLTVSEERLFGEDENIYGPVEGQREERIFKFHPRFPREADYRVKIFFEADGEPWTIELPIVVGEPGSPWVVLGSIGAGLALFLIFIRAARIKLKRRELTATRVHGRGAARS